MPNEIDDIKEVIEKAYIQGVHVTQDEPTIRSGFHPDFAMLVFSENSIQKVMISDWLERVEKMKVDNPALWSAETRHEFKLVDVSGYAALAKLDVYKGDVHFSTDYMLLYKFEEGWKIVSKIFDVPQ
jgi:hypothetical protein